VEDRRDDVTDALRFPIGDFRAPATTTESERVALIEQIEAAPARLREAIKGLGREQLETSYRPGGWTVRQVVHHVPDSHLNSYMRFRLALTEDEPTIKPYQEDRWAELPDARTAPPEMSLDLLEALHRRWTRLLRSLTPPDWERRFRHPELGLMSLERTLALYAWHGRHHVAHITSLRDRMGWH
jgi:uncharacterized damage-inducible protein DinB